MSKRTYNVVVMRADKETMDGERVQSSEGRCPRCGGMLFVGLDSEPACFCGYHDWSRMPTRYGRDGELAPLMEW